MITREREKQAYLLAYTRAPLPDSYPEGLAYSLHLAYSPDGKWFYPLHENYGVLFAEGEVSAEDTIVPKGLRNPRIVGLGGGSYGIYAQLAAQDGEPDPESADRMLFWTTEDFVEFRRQPPVRRSAELEARLEGAALLHNPPGLQDVEEGCCISVDASFAACVRRSYERVRHTGILLPERLPVSAAEEIDGIRAAAVYSDGSVDLKKVRWDKTAVDFTRPGTYEVTGRIEEEHHPFPLACGYGDPVLLWWEGSWYFIATNDNTDDVGFYVRKAEDVGGLFAEDAVEHLILGRDEERGFVQTFWAPEFHVIGGKLWILFAVSGKEWGPQCWMMRHREGCDLIDPDGWEEPVRVCRKDASPLCADGITLDMTYLDTAHASYLVWSYRRHIGTEEDTGSMLYIARADVERPWQLESEPVLLSRPLYGWENVSGTINNEGPHGFVKGGRVYLTYSGGSANAYTYAVGLLTADADADLLEVSNWEKSNTPVISFYSVEGEYGPGHNSFYEDTEGKLWIAYHAEDALEHHVRCDAVRRVHFGADGRPVFDLSAERSLNPDFAEVRMKVVVAG